MEFIILLIIVIVFYFILRFIFGYELKKIKEIGEDKNLDKITEKYPNNIEICKYYLKKLNNEDVKVEEDNNSGATLYLVMTNKISIGNLKNSYTRIQTLAHECLHSVQNKRMLWFNFIFSNIYLLYFILICILDIFKVLPYKMLFLNILLLLGFFFYAVRVYLENDAMTKARFLAKEYMEDTKISSKEEIQQIVNRYDKLNDIGIRCTNFQLLGSVLFKVIVLLIIFMVR